MEVLVSNFEESDIGEQIVAGDRFAKVLGRRGKQARGYIWRAVRVQLRQRSPAAAAPEVVDVGDEVRVIL